MIHIGKTSISMDHFCYVSHYQRKPVVFTVSSRQQWFHSHVHGIPGSCNDPSKDKLVLCIYDNDIYIYIYVFNTYIHTKTSWLCRDQGMLIYLDFFDIEKWVRDRNLMIKIHLEAATSRFSQELGQDGPADGMVKSELPIASRSCTPW